MRTIRLPPRWAGRYRRTLLGASRHAILSKDIKGFTFGMRSRDLLAIIGDVVGAKEPPAPAAAIV
jgi:hypothetical protein